MVWIGREQGMDRAERKHIRLIRSRLTCQSDDTGSVADAAVTGTAQSINLGSNPPNALVRRNVRDRRAASRGHGHCNAPIGYFTGVITERLNCRQPYAPGPFGGRQVNDLAVFLRYTNPVGYARRWW